MNVGEREEKRLVSESVLSWSEEWAIDRAVCWVEMEG